LEISGVVLVSFYSLGKDCGEVFRGVVELFKWLVVEGLIVRPLIDAKMWSRIIYFFWSFDLRFFGGGF
jgi:hypothetical protein